MNATKQQRWNAGFAARWLTGCAALALSGTAHAQSVDYGALEEVFGEPVTTSATGKPQKVSEVPVNMEIITADDIRRNGADNIPDILRFYAGIDVRRYGVASASVAIRGYNQSLNPRMLVLLNGRQVYLDDYGLVDWSAIPVQLDEIRQIEVVKGPNSALFGFNAASGVINIITYDPLLNAVNAATFRTGTQGLVEGSVVGTAQFADKAGVRISLGGMRVNDFKPRGVSASDVQGRVAPEIGSLAVDTRVIVADGVQAIFTGSVNDSRSNTVVAAIPSAVYFRTNSFGSSVNAETDLGVFGLNFYRNESRDRYNNAFEFSTDTYVVQASDLVKLSASHVIRIDLEYRTTTTTFNNQFNEVAGYDVLSASGMWDWQITPSLALTNAVRVDHLALNYQGLMLAGSPFTAHDYNSKSLTVPSFNTGLVYKASDLDTIRLTAARGLELPSLLAYGVSVPLPGRALYATPNLSPTSVTNFELGYDRQVAELASTLRGTVFFQRNADIIAFGTSVPPVLLPSGQTAFVTANAGSSDAVGIEIGIHGKSESGLRWNGSYVFEKISDKLNLIKSNSTQDYTKGTPTHVVIAGLGYTLGPWDFDGQGRWQSSFTDYTSSGFSLKPVQVGNYVTLNAHIGYKIHPNLTLGVTAQQFNNSRLLEAAVPPVERRIIASVTAHF